MKKIFYTILTMLFVNFGNAQIIYSKLFDSTTYNATLLRNFTAAGYRSGTKPIPNYPVKVNVVNYGATPNDTSNDKSAFTAAINACGDSGTIYIPAGVYIIKDSIQVRKKRIVFRGAGQGKTILRFEKGLRELYPRTDNNYSWSFALITFQGSNPSNNSSGAAIEDAGIENLSIVFPDSTWAGHDFQERGYNAIGFDRFASHCWVRNIQVIGCDMGVWVSTTCSNITIQNIEFLAGPTRSNSTPISPNYDGGKIGHHGINIYGKYNLIQDFNFTGKFAHDLSVESDSAKYNVFRRGRGFDMNIDHHHHGQRFNLFTHLDMGQGSRPFKSSGSTEPQGISVSETYWCLKANQNLNYFTQYDDSLMKSRNNVAVGVRTSIASNLPDTNNNWLENINPNLLKPQDLYAAQLIYLNKTKYYEWPVFATRSSGNSSPVNAIDGSLQTVWSASGYGDYLSFSLSDATNVNAIKIAFDSANFRKYRFSVFSSVDGITWINAVADTQSSVNVSGFEWFRFNSTRLAKYFKIIGLGCTNNSGNTQPIDTNLISIQEIGVAYQTTTNKDAFVRDGSSNASRNFGGDSILTVKKDAVSFNREAYLQFNLSNVKPVIASAKLSLRLRYANVNITTAKWQVAFVQADSWKEDSINWNNSATSSAPFSDTINGTSNVGSLVDWNVTNMVTADINNNDTLISLKLINLVSNVAGDANFHSKEASNPNNRPILTIEYKAESINSANSTNAISPIPLLVEKDAPLKMKQVNKIFPNPIGNQMNIVLNEGDEHICVYNAMGKPVYNANIKHQKQITVKTGAWQTGIYFVTIINQKANIITTQVIK